jgi:hypothetical protein
MPASEFRVSMLADLVSGPTTAYGEWVVTGPVVTTPGALVIIGGNLSVSDPSWGGFVLTNVAYTPGPIPWRSSTGETLAAFSLPLPFP